MFIDEPKPGLEHSKYSQRINEIIEWLSSKKIKISHTRIRKYQKFLDKLKDKNDFTVNTNDDFLVLEEFLYILTEVHELMWIKKGVDTVEPKGLNKLLKIISGGNYYSHDDADTTARNYQFELRVASYLMQKCYEVDLSQITDVIGKKNGISFYFECKRLSSEKNASKKIKEASKQLKQRLSNQNILSKKYGIAAFDVTQLAFPNQGALQNFTHDQCKRHLRNLLSDINSSYDFIKPFQSNKRVIAVWLQIHVPSLAVSASVSAETGKPTFIQPTTRFSSKFAVLGPTNGPRGKAIEQLKTAIEIHETVP